MVRSKLRAPPFYHPYNSSARALKAVPIFSAARVKRLPISISSRRERKAKSTKKSTCVAPPGCGVKVQRLVRCVNGPLSSVA